MNLIASRTPQTLQRQSAINLPWPPEMQALGMEGMDTSPGEADNIFPQEIYAHLKRSLLKHPAAEGIYLLGSGAWRIVNVVPVEEDLEVPVVHPVAARVWYVQNKRASASRWPARAAYWPNCHSGPTQQFRSKNTQRKFNLCN